MAEIYFPFCLVLVLVSLSTIFAPPVDKKEDATGSPEDFRNDPLYRLEYERYLQEVVQLLESDPDFKKKLENAKPEDIDSGKIADELALVNHTIRTRLTEAKRREVQRINDLLEQLEEKTEHRLDEVKGHLEHSPSDFSEEDLRKLIFKAKKDMDQIDRLRHEEFKLYEMRKRFEREQQLALLEPDQRSRQQADWDEQAKRHAQHDPVFHPFSADQLQELWEKGHGYQGALDAETLFKLQDVNSDGHWDAEEVEALFQLGLDKVYQLNVTEDDMLERIEEMNRMREHVFGEADKDQDGLLTFAEFDAARRETLARREASWDTLDKNPAPVFSELEYEQFRLRQPPAANASQAAHDADGQQKTQPSGNETHEK